MAEDGRAADDDGAAGDGGGEGMIEFDTDYWDDDPVFYITEDGKCSGCHAQLDFDELAPLNFEAEESGQGTDGDGNRMYWASGTITCPNCQVKLPYEVST